ncbi:MAG: hypothetical protein JXR37_28895 [Kiritimatiellae bacterium]|nr:hypothetical protein [Kiritimatiellia bacterium]
MTPRQRMLAAYRGEIPDTVPVAPEFWYYVPCRLLGVSMVEFERDIPLWQALQQTFRHYRTDGWGIVPIGVPGPDLKSKGAFRELGRGRYEASHEVTTPHGTLRCRSQYDEQEPSWPVERYIKDFERDWPAYAYMSLEREPDAIEWAPVREALEAVGEEYLLEPMLPGPFFDFIALQREGGLEQAVFDLTEQEPFFEALHERYLDYAVRVARAAGARSGADSFFVGCSWSCVSLIGPRLWRRWDRPVIRAMADELHKHGKLLHVHFHGKCMDVIDDLRECGADCICPFERAPGGDVTDLAEVRRRLADRVTVNGNVHTVETLIRGTPADVTREVEEIFEHWGADKRRLILGTGDQVGRETPDANIRAMIDAGRKWGKT